MEPNMTQLPASPKRLRNAPPSNRITKRSTQNIKRSERITLLNGKNRNVSCVPNDHPTRVAISSSQMLADLIIINQNTGHIITIGCGIRYRHKSEVSPG